MRGHDLSLQIHSLSQGIDQPTMIYGHETWDKDVKMNYGVYEEVMMD